MLLEDNIGEYFHDIGGAKDFVNEKQKSTFKKIYWTTLKLGASVHQKTWQGESKLKGGSRYLQYI